MSIRCRPNLSGRTCSVPEQNFFVGPVDTLVSEAELSNCGQDVCILRMYFFYKYSKTVDIFRIVKYLFENPTEMAGITHGLVQGL